jgi:N-acetylmuramoyl-L-alanine amidase
MTDVEVLARTIWAEARNGGKAGMENVAQVILNRAANPRWWGNSARGVCLAKMQFSCWWVKDANYKRMIAVGGDDRAFATAREVASKALLGSLGDDRTKGADHYYAPNGMVGAGAPRWADEAKFTMAAHGHCFYRLELPAPAPRPAEVPKSAITVPITAAAGIAAQAADTLGGLDWRVGIAAIVAVAVGVLVWRFWLAKRDAGAE